MNILNMDGWTVLQLDEREGEYRVIAQPTHPPTNCPACGSGQFYRFGTRPEVIMDLPMHGKRVGIQAQRRRFRCRSCSQTFVEPTPGVDSQHRATERLVDWIARQSLARTFTNVADEIGLNEITIRRLFADHVEILTKDWEDRVITPRWLGIDELKLAGQFRGIMTNVEARTVIDLLPKHTKDTVVRRLSRMPNRDRVEVVTIDMHWAYKYACDDLVPQAAIVIDKFHVERMATDGLEIIRRRMRSEFTDEQRKRLKRDRHIMLSRPYKLKPSDLFLLDTWADNFPKLREAYDLKEAFYRIYDHGTPETAGEMLDAWTASIPDDMKDAFKELTTASRRWRPQILAYFRHRVTNAYTECLNGLAKKANRLGRGYSFDAIRAKVLFHEGAARAKRGGYMKRRGLQEPQRSSAGLPILEMLGEPDHGDLRILLGAGMSVVSEPITIPLDAHLGKGLPTMEGLTLNFDDMLDSTTNVE